MMLKTLAFAAGLCSFASAYSPFLVQPLTTHQPSGNPDGQVNYYHIEFNVTSANGGSGSGASANCKTSWGDNSWADSEAYSRYVPTGDWIACSPNDFQFQLAPYFSIGNFSLMLQQNFTDVDTSKEVIANGTMHVSNTTSTYTCDINPTEVQYQQHAHGDCCMPKNADAFSMPIESAVVVPECTSENATATFEVTGSISAGQEILLVGSIPELGNWAPSKAILLSSSDNDGSVSSPTFSGSMEIPAGTAFEYKYLMRETGGSETWECCENRVFTVAAGAACSKMVAGNGPDYFRGGGDAVQS